MATSIRKPLVLVVEDDDDVRDAVVNLLEEEGFAVVEAANGKIALDVLGDGLSPSVILLDLMLPVVSGWSVWDWLQQHDTLHKTPVVIFTATGLRNGSMGKTPVIEKPFDNQKLIATLTNAAKRAA